MGETRKSPNRRQRGNIETLRSGALRVRVYSGRDPVTKRTHYVTETIPAGTPNIEKAAEQALTRLLNRVDEQRAPRTNASIGQLIDAYLAVVDIDRSTMNGWRSKVQHQPQLRGALVTGEDLLTGHPQLDFGVDLLVREPTFPGSEECLGVLAGLE